MWIFLRRSWVYRKAIKCSVQAGHRRWSSLRWFSVSCGTNQTDRPHVGIVGSGPAGFYTAQQILKVCTFVLQREIVPSPLPPAPEPTGLKIDGWILFVFYEGGGWGVGGKRPRSKWGTISMAREEIEGEKWISQRWQELVEIGECYPI